MEKYVFHNGMWRRVDSSFVRHNGVFRKVHQRKFSYNIIISFTVLNYNLRNAIINAGWDQNIPVRANVVITQGGIIGSANTGAFAFDTGGPFPAESEITIHIQPGGIICGAGGNGGVGSDSTGSGGTAGFPGGPALRAQTNISIINHGIIAGGGGGGGGGGGFLLYNAAGSGGGGAGWIPGNGGPARAERTNGGAGQNGSLFNGGAGGLGGAGGKKGGLPGDPNRRGGRGGNLGQPGEAGWQNGTPTASPGGSPGAAITGNAFINWVVTGDRRGPIS